MKTENRSRLLIIALLVSVCMISLTCTPSDKAAAPPGLGYHAMAYDAESNVVIVFGGQLKDYTPTSSVNMTWAYDCASNTWRKMSPDVRPTRSAGHAMAYDSESDRIVLFSGQTWAYDYNGNSWQKKRPEQTPIAPFGGCSMAYDVESDRVVLFGVPSNDTWAYDLNSDTWTAMKPAISPPKRQYPALAYDQESDRIILFGGGTGVSAPHYSKVYDDTWSYDLDTNSWMELQPSKQPTKRVYHSMTYHSALDRIVMFGGWSYDVNNPVDNKVWSYDTNSNTWDTVTVEANLVQKRKQAMVYVTQENCMIIYGGISVTPQPAGEAPFTKDLWLIKF